jgi:hypothetical protein
MEAERHSNAESDGQSIEPSIGHERENGMLRENYVPGNSRPWLSLDYGNVGKNKPYWLRRQCHHASNGESKLWLSLTYGVNTLTQNSYWIILNYNFKSDFTSAEMYLELWTSKYGPNNAWI